MAHTFFTICWAEARIKIARMTLTIKLDGNWSSFQLANSTPPLSVTGSAIAPSARMVGACAFHVLTGLEHAHNHVCIGALQPLSQNFEIAKIKKRATTKKKVVLPSPGAFYFFIYLCDE